MLTEHGMAIAPSTYYASKQAGQIPNRCWRPTTRTRSTRCGNATAASTVPDQIWVADLTYVWTVAGFVYVAFLVDVGAGARVGDI